MSAIFKQMSYQADLIDVKEYFIHLNALKLDFSVLAAHTIVFKCVLNYFKT